LVHKAFFVLAGIFCTIAVIVPMTILVMQADNDIDNLIITQNPAGMATDGNVSLPTAEELQESHTATLSLILVVEVVFVSLVVVTLYYGLKTHPVPNSMNKQNAQIASFQYYPTQINPICKNARYLSLLLWAFGRLKPNIFA
jgi:hypothetical protein